MLARILGFLLLSSSTALAFPTTALKYKATKKGHALSHKKLNCTDFSGQWVGACTDSDGETRYEVLQIDQYSCENIDIGGMSLAIGGLTNITSAEKDGGSAITFVPTWSGDQLKINFSLQASGIDRAFAGIYTLKMTDERLAAEMDLGEARQSCSYQKKNN